MASACINAVTDITAIVDVRESPPVVATKDAAMTAAAQTNRTTWIQMVATAPLNRTSIPIVLV